MERATWCVQGAVVVLGYTSVVTVCAFQLTVNARTGDVLHNVSTAAFANDSFLLNTA